MNKNRPLWHTTIWTAVFDGKSTLYTAWGKEGTCFWVFFARGKLGFPPWRPLLQRRWRQVLLLLRGGGREDGELPRVVEQSVKRGGGLPCLCKAKLPGEFYSNITSKLKQGQKLECMVVKSTHTTWQSRQEHSKDVREHKENKKTWTERQTQILERYSIAIP